MRQAKGVLVVANSGCEHRVSGSWRRVPRMPSRWRAYACREVAEIGKSGIGVPTRRATRAGSPAGPPRNPPRRSNEAWLIVDKKGYLSVVSGPVVAKAILPMSFNMARSRQSETAGIGRKLSTVNTGPEPIGSVLMHTDSA